MEFYYHEFRRLYKCYSDYILKKIIQTRAKIYLVHLTVKIDVLLYGTPFYSFTRNLSCFLKQIDLGISIRKLNSIKTLFIILTGNENKIILPETYFIVH